MKGDKEVIDMVNRNHEFRKWTGKLKAISAGRRKKGKKWKLQICLKA